MGLKKIFSDSIAIAEKDLKLDLRYKIVFFSETVVMPMAIVVPFILVYYGYLVSGSAALYADIGQNNFIVFLLLGTITSIVLHEGFNNFFTRFANEKSAKTIESLALAPINKISLIIGGAIDGIVSLIPAIFIFFTICQVFFPTGILNMVQILILIVLLLLVSLSLGLVAGLTSIFNSNYSPIFRYMIIGLTFVSCFYYPISLFDSHPLLGALKPVVEMNPYYHGVSLIRGLWFYGSVQWNSFFYVLIFALTMPFISVFIFNKAWKMFIIEEQ